MVYVVLTAKLVDVFLSLSFMSDVSYINMYLSRFRLNNNFLGFTLGAQLASSGSLALTSLYRGARSDIVYVILMSLSLRSVVIYMHIHVRCALFMSVLYILSFIMLEKAYIDRSLLHNFLILSSAIAMLSYFTDTIGHMGIGRYIYISSGCDSLYVWHAQYHI